APSTLRCARIPGPIADQYRLSLAIACRISLLVGSGIGFRTGTVADRDNRRAYLDGLSLVDQQRLDGAFEWAGQFDYRFGRFNIDDDIINGHRVANSSAPCDDFCFGQALADI